MQLINLDVDAFAAFRELLNIRSIRPIFPLLSTFSEVFRSRLALVRVYRSSSPTSSLSVKGLDDFFDDRFSKDLYSQRELGLSFLFSREIKSRTKCPLNVCWKETRIICSWRLIFSISRIHKYIYFFLIMACSCLLDHVERCYLRCR